MTQEEFAERIGISQNYLSTMERCKVEIGAQAQSWLGTIQAVPRLAGLANGPKS